jgi:hypothetical protein
MWQNIILLLKYCSRLIFFSVSLVFQIVLDHPVSWHLGDFGIILFFCSNSILRFITVSNHASYRCVCLMYIIDLAVIAYAALDISIF